MQDNLSPKGYVILGMLFLCACWQMGVLVIAVVVYFVCGWMRIRVIPLTLIGLALVLASWLLVYYGQENSHVTIFLLQGFRKNVLFFKLLTRYNLKLALYFQFKYAWQYLLGFPVIVAALLHVVNTWVLSPHALELKRMSQGKLGLPRSVGQRRIDRKLKQLLDEEADGILLGISEQTLKPLVMPDYYANQIVLVLGTTGSGKTITQRRFYQRAIYKGYPLIIVDGKPSKENVDGVWQLARLHNRDFYGFNCGNNAYYNALSGEGYTELKDKIITLKDEWESDYYKTIAEDYLQTTLEVLIKSGQRVDLKTVAKCLDFEYLASLVREARNQVLAEKIQSLQHYERKALTGVQAHLNVLINSELGEYLNFHPEAFSLNKVIQQKAVTYFALPALKFSNFGKVLGKLIINDIKSMIEPLENKQPIFIVFDEFSVFAGEQVLNLVNMGRGKGVHAILGTQGLADLKKVDNVFESQLLNCVNTVICHRLNDQNSAECITMWIGTEDSYDVTAVVNTDARQSNMGSLAKNKSFIVHPDDIKQKLNTGEAYFATKVNKFRVDKIKVKL
jgi:conjugal transfer pilus assembly protein TraD